MNEYNIYQIIVEKSWYQIMAAYQILPVIARKKSLFCFSSADQTIIIFALVSSWSNYLYFLLRDHYLIINIRYLAIIRYKYTLYSPKTCLTPLTLGISIMKLTNTQMPFLKQCNKSLLRYESIEMLYWLMTCSKCKIEIVTLIFKLEMEITR